MKKNIKSNQIKFNINELISQIDQNKTIFDQMTEAGIIFTSAFEQFHQFKQKIAEEQCYLKLEKEVYKKVEKALKRKSNIDNEARFVVPDRAVRKRVRDTPIKWEKTRLSLGNLPSLLYTKYSPYYGHSALSAVLPPDPSSLYVDHFDQAIWYRLCKKMLKQGFAIRSVYAKWPAFLLYISPNTTKTLKP